MADSKEITVSKHITVSNRLYDFARSLVGNRVLDLYLKYKGITMLTSTTLVPIALILGQQAFSAYLDSNGKQQEGGNIHIPVLDAPGIGTFLKLAGLYHLPLTASTLVPLGILMMLYKMHTDHKLLGGGKVKDTFYKFAKGIVGNRVLDLYLKYKGITMLNAYTLVPIALILGQQVFQDYMKHDVVPASRGGSKYKRNKRISMKLEKYAGKMAARYPAGRRENARRRTEIVLSGGGRIRVPFIDDPLIGNYLKLAGLYTLPLQAGTLLPLGILMVIYRLYESNGQLGGTPEFYPVIKSI